MTSYALGLAVEDQAEVPQRKTMRVETHEPSARQLEEAFRHSMRLPAHLEARFGAAIEHLLRHPGSMVRPRLVHQVAVAYGMSAKDAMDLAVALEYFHTASLVFDDLPCMDDARSRRGVPCVHVNFGEAGAMLAGLALINRAYALAWKAIHASSREVQSRGMQYLEERLGVEGLLNGQSFDLNYAHLPHDRETTERIACGKTVSLIRLTLVLPALLGGAGEREVQLLERIATCWGLSYQMVDDLKDVLQSTTESGKTVARDELLNRPNIALVLGVPAAVQRLTRLIHAGDRTLERLLMARPGLAFLGRLRLELEGELERVLEKVRPSWSEVRG